ncbi:hypothetical protein ABIE65_005156 [Constrictibacter sp. MBR-5]
MVCRSPPKFRYLTRATVSCRGMAGRPRGTSPARRALVNRTAFGVSAFGFDPWRERPLRGRVAVQRRRPRRAPLDAMVTGPGGENAAWAMAPKARFERHPSCISGSDGRAHEVERGAARRRSDWSRRLRLRWRSGASFIAAAMPSTARSGSFGHARRAVEGRVVGDFRVVATPVKPSSDAVNSVTGKAMALLRRLFIEAVTIPACLSSRKSRAGPFNPPSGKISPAAKSAPLTLRPFG